MSFFDKAKKFAAQASAARGTAHDRPRNETEITIDSHVPLVRLSRAFDAPRDKVFRAHVDPELFSRWNGPRGTEMKVDHFDCRTGGAYRYLVTREGFEAVFRGPFHEVRPNELIVQTFTFEGVRDGYERLDELLASEG